jgi:isoamylase
VHNDAIGVKDVTWLTPAATEMAPEQWSDGRAKCFGVMFDGRAQTSGIRRPAADTTALLVVNSHHDVVRFKLPEAVGGARWELLIDTNIPGQDEIRPFPFGHEYEVTSHSLLLFALQSEGRRDIIGTTQQALRTVAARPAPVPTPVEPETADTAEEQEQEAVT